MKVVLAQPRGFCAGVERAIDAVREVLDRHGAPVYVRHEIVHNHHVVESLKARGAVFVDELAEVPDGAVVLFSAHGVAPAVEAEAAARGLLAIDATCPLVTKVHLEVAEHARAGRTVFLVGHAGHPEVVGTLGHYRANGGEIHVVQNEQEARSVQARPAEGYAYVSQTTLSVSDTARTVDALRERFAGLRGPHKDDICYATQNRQRAVMEIARRCDVVVVIGDAHSSNSVRLREVAEAQGRPAHLVDSAARLERDWFAACAAIGLTSGASVPERLVDEALATFRGWWPGLEEETVGTPETVHFRLPRHIDETAAAH